MAQLDLSEKEVAALRETLESYLSDLRMEISDTDERSFREALKQKKEVLDGILGRLSEARS